MNANANSMKEWERVERQKYTEEKKNYFLSFSSKKVGSLSFSALSFSESLETRNSSSIFGGKSGGIPLYIHLLN